jgi:predicted nucleic acid-binding protein
MIVVDTSVAVAAAFRMHAAHRRVQAALPARPTRLLGPVAVETYSVLTRMPMPGRLAPSVARAYLREKFELPPLVLDGTGVDELLEAAAQTGIPGGAIYDAIVAATASAAGATLLTLDHRAARTYDLVGATYELLE